jgi:hypothetical protein
VWDSEWKMGILWHYGWCSQNSMGGGLHALQMVNFWRYGWEFSVLMDGATSCNVRKGGPKGLIYSLRGNLVLYSRHTSLR